MIKTTDLAECLGPLPHLDLMTRREMFTQLTQLLLDHDEYEEKYGELKEQVLDYAYRGFARLLDVPTRTERTHIHISNTVMEDCTKILHEMKDATFIEKLKPEWLRIIPEGSYVITFPYREMFPWMMEVDAHQVQLLSVYEADDPRGTVGLDYFFIRTKLENDLDVKVEDTMSMMQYLSFFAPEIGFSRSAMRNLLAARVTLVYILFYIWANETEDVVVKGGGSKVVGIRRYKGAKHDVKIITRARNRDYHHVMGCLVRGHMRLQPYGPRDKPEYKLIYIKPFSKKPYTRKGSKQLR